MAAPISPGALRRFQDVVDSIGATVVALYRECIITGPEARLLLGLSPEADNA